MCGRTKMDHPVLKLLARFGALADPLLDTLWEPRQYFRPTNNILVVLPLTATSEAGSQHGRLLSAMHWGWSDTYNARIERVQEPNGIWTEAFAQRRCLIPVTTYYERQLGVSSATDDVLALGGIFTLQHSGVAMLTQPANEQISQVHHRMPIAIAPDAWDRWLNPNLLYTWSGTPQLPELTEDQVTYA